MNFDEYLAETLANDEDLRKEYESLMERCSGCIYENIDDTTDAISNCVCCRRKVEFAKNDYYKKK